MFERVRVGEGEGRPERCAAFLGFFAAQGCRMVEMTCEEHDRAAASTQARRIALLKMRFTWFFLLACILPLSLAY
jgi:hypothetical protein